MATFFFNVDDGVCVPDDTGTELASVRAAQLEAIVLLGRLLQEGAADFCDHGELTVSVADQDGLVLFSINAFIIRGAAHIGPRPSAGGAANAT